MKTLEVRNEYIYRAIAPSYLVLNHQIETMLIHYMIVTQK